MIRGGLVVFLMLVSLALPLMAKEAWLVTYGPGHEVWERFGHNAIWLRDSSIGLDHVYSFGYFDMDGPGFYLDFADRKSTRLNSSHVAISYAVFCLKKKTNIHCSYVVATLH